MHVLKSRIILRFGHNIISQSRIRVAIINGSLISLNRLAMKFPAKFNGVIITTTMRKILGTMTTEATTTTRVTTTTVISTTAAMISKSIKSPKMGCKSKTIFFLRKRWREKRWRNRSVSNASKSLTKCGYIFS